MYPITMNDINISKTWYWEKKQKAQRNGCSEKEVGEKEIVLSKLQRPIFETGFTHSLRNGEIRNSTKRKEHEQAFTIGGQQMPKKYKASMD